MLIVLTAEHPELEALEREAGKEPGYLLDWFPECGLHPEEQVARAERRIKDSREYTVVLVTYSQIFIYALNNAMLRDAALQVEAYKVTKDGRENILNDRFIDETVLGWTMEKLASEFNKLAIRRSSREEKAKEKGK